MLEYSRKIKYSQLFKRPDTASCNNTYRPMQNTLLSKSW